MLTELNASVESIATSDFLTLDRVHILIKELDAEYGIDVPVGSFQLRQKLRFVLQVDDGDDVCPTCGVTKEERERLELLDSEDNETMRD